MQNTNSRNITLQYRVAMQVRDYECDTQGVVNNAVYLNYLEHARNQLFWNKNLSLTDLHVIGEDPVVARIEIQYLYPLHAREHFYIDTQVELKGNFKLLFHQQIYKLSLEQDNVLQSTQKARDKELEFIDTHTAKQNDNAVEFRLHAKATVTVAVLHNGKPTLIENTKLYTALTQ